MIKSESSKIKSFNPIIYPRILYVAKNLTVDEINKRFVVFDGNGKESVADEKSICESKAVTFSVVDKRTNNFGVAVILYNNATIGNNNATKGYNNVTIGTLAHESVHAADIIFEQLGMYTQGFNEGNEPYAYLVGWITDCLNKIYIQ